MQSQRWITWFCVLMLTGSLMAQPVAAFVEEGKALPAETLGGRGILTQAEKNEALIKAAQNPIANMVSVPFQNNFGLGYGPDGKMQYVCNIQPVYPIDLPHKWTLITRNILPVIAQPWPRNTGGLGDLTSSFFFTPPPFGNLMVGWALRPNLVRLAKGTERAVGLRAYFQKRKAAAQKPV